MIESAAESEARGMIHNGQTYVTLCITLNKIGFPLLPTPIKTGNPASEVIVTATVRQKMSKTTDIQF